MKYKNLTIEQLLISFDRLTRFKPTKEKYLRVFSDIISANLREPVYKKQEILNMPRIEMKQLAEEIINDSLNAIYPHIVNTNYNINTFLKDYENSLFINDIDTQILLDNKISYTKLIPLINESCPINLRWLKALYDIGDNIFDCSMVLKLRHDKGLKFPIKKVILVEGITEEILLPSFSKYLGFDFYREGMHVIAAGGKNQVVKMYYKLIEELKLPVFILLDKDAEENIIQIKPKLRDIDKIHLVSCGEFEDLLPVSLIVKTVNNELCNFAAISENDIDVNIPTVKNLENIFKTKGLHEFKKAEFAKLVRDNIINDSDVSEEIYTIIQELKI